VRHVLNIIGERAGDALYTTYLPDHGPVVRLAKTCAIEVSFDGDPVKVMAEARRCNADHPLDINVVPAEGRRKKLLVADMDSTIISCECLDELADMAGLKDKVSAITERAMRGEIEFAGALRERVGLLKGLPLAALDRVWYERVRLNPGAKELVATMKAQGAYTLLVSGGFTFFTARVAEATGFDEHQSNVLIDDGKTLSGEVREPILGREAKLAALEGAVAKLGIAYDDVLAVGDGANDLAMIQRAGLGVAYHAKPVVAAAAGASIAHNDLRALLYLQGYRDSEITSA
jgi:phosphoserine phosphatase